MTENPNPENAEEEPETQYRTLTRPELADELGCSTKTIQRYKADGCPHEIRTQKCGDTVFYNLDEVQNWMNATGRSLKAKNLPKEERDIVAQHKAAQVRKELAMAAKHEMDNEIKAGRLMDKQMAIAEFSNLATGFRNAMLQLASSLAPALVGLDAEEIEAEIERAIRQELQRLSDGAFSD